MSPVLLRAASRLFLLWALIVATCAGAAHAQAETWLSMKSVNLDLASGRTVVDVSDAAGQFKAIRIVAKSGNATLTKVVVTYAQGAAHSEDRTITLLAGERTAAIGAGPDRFVDRVEISGRPQPGAPSGPVVIEVWGLQSPDGARAVRSGPPIVAAKPKADTAVDDAAVRRGQAEEERKRAAAAAAESARQAQTAQRERAFELAKPAPQPSTRSVGAAAPPLPPAAPAPAAAGAQSPGSGGTRGLGSAAPPAAAALPYATVPVLFGTDRKQGPDRKAKWGATVATYGIESQFKLALGQAMVTVPTKEGVRERGSVPRPELVVFGFRVPWGEEQLDKHFTIYSARPLSEAAFLDEVRNSLGKSKSFEKHAMLFVHGYNVTFEDALYRTAQMVHDLEFDGAAFTYSWPSKGDPRAYLYDEDRVKGARPFLREYLELISSKADVKHLHIVAHSKGADLLVEVLREMSATADMRSKLRINEIILAAPDIDRANFEQMADKIVGLAQRGVTLYASNNDKALTLSKTVRLGTERAGEISATQGPFMARGLDTIDISAASTSFFSDNHSTFAERLPLITDMHTILSKGTHPPDQRSQKLFSPVTTERGKYWKYVK